MDIFNNKLVSFVAEGTSFEMVYETWKKEIILYAIFGKNGRFTPIFQKMDYKCRKEKK